MKVVQITDEDAKALLEELELAKYRGPVWWKSATAEVDGQARDAVTVDCHRHFHFIVTSWLQKHGANVTS